MKIFGGDVHVVDGVNSGCTGDLRRSRLLIISGHHPKPGLTGDEVPPNVAPDGPHAGGNGSELGGREGGGPEV